MGNYLADRRIALGLTQKEVAESVGVTEATVSRWESGTIANMRRDKIKLLAKALDSTPNFIMTGEGDPSPSPEPQEKGKKNDMFRGARDMIDNWNAERVYRDAIHFRKPEAEKTIEKLYSYFQFEVFQFDEDAVEGMVTIATYGSEKGFRVPEYKIEDQKDMAAHLIEIVGYMPENTPTESSLKLQTLLLLLNASGVNKTLAYVEGLMENTQYHVKMKLYDIEK